MINQIFINLAVKDLKKSMEFFSKLGFKFNPQFTNENGACMIIKNDVIFSMLITEKFFKTFIPNKNICDSKKDKEVLNALSVNSRKDVDDMINKVINAGGKEFREAQDYGWMYARAFEDLDNHVWEVFYGDESKMPEEMKNKGVK